MKIIVKDQKFKTETRKENFIFIRVFIIWIGIEKKMYIFMVNILLWRAEIEQ
jgi:hypothetical protein